MKIEFNIICAEDATAEEREIFNDIVRQHSGIITSDKIVRILSDRQIRMVSNKQLRMIHDDNLNSLFDSMCQIWVNRMPPMYFADSRPYINVDWGDYLYDKEQGKITVTFKTEFLH